MQYNVPHPESSSRLLNFLIVIKFFLAIPHMVVLGLYGLGANIVTFLAWWAVLFTGTYPRGMFDFMVNYLRFTASVQAYVTARRDEYPPSVSRGVPLTAVPGPSTASAALSSLSSSAARRA